MKKLLMGAAALAAMSATSPAFASTDATSTYTVSGTVGSYCSANTTGTIDFGDLGGGTANLTATSKSADADTTAFCNGANSTIAISHDNLTNTTVDASLVTTPPTGFTGTVTFTPTVSIAGGTPLTDDQSGTVVGAFVGLQVAATNLAPGIAGAKLLAGSYSGKITVVLSPAQ